MSARALEASPVAETAPSLLSVVIPTFNEAGNVREIVARLDRTLKGIPWEVIFVDDNSPDGTAGVVKSVARDDLRVRCLKRLGRRGLAGACIEGMLASSAPYVAVMDADLQHDERILPRMLALLASDWLISLWAAAMCQGAARNPSRPTARDSAAPRQASLAGSWAPILPIR